MASRSDGLVGLAARLVMSLAPLADAALLVLLAAAAGARVVAARPRRGPSHDSPSRPVVPQLPDVLADLLAVTLQPALGIGQWLVVDAEDLVLDLTGDGREDEQTQDALLVVPPGLVQPRASQVPAAERSHCVGVVRRRMHGVHVAAQLVAGRRVEPHQDSHARLGGPPILEDVVSEDERDPAARQHEVRPGVNGHEQAHRPVEVEAHGVDGGLDGGERVSLVGQEMQGAHRGLLFTAPARGQPASRLAGREDWPSATPTHPG